MAKKKPQKTIKKIEVHIPMGLPGAGKTTLYQKMKSDSFMEVLYVDGDCYRNISFDGLLDRSRYESSCWKLPDVILFDGLFLNVASFVETAKKIKEYVVSKYISNIDDKNTEYQFVLVIDYWTPDVELCLYNDAARHRDDPATDTIKNSVLETVSESDVAKELGDTFDAISIVQHKTEKADIINEIYKYCGCYDNYIHSNSWDPASEAPEDFELFDEIIFTLCPDISYMMYKRIWKEAGVFGESSKSSDYYSNDVSYSCCWYVDINNLRKVLEKYNII